MKQQLNGSSQAISLGESSYAIRAPGIRGQAELSHPRNATERSRSRTAQDGTAELEQALAAANIVEIRQVELQLQPPAPTVAAAPLRSVGGVAEIELQVPDLGPDSGQLVLACQNGVLTWHLPVDTEHVVQPPASRGAGGVKRFRIPASATPAAAHPDAAQRSLLGVVGRTLLKVLVYPVSDVLVGKGAEFFAERWEESKRPYGVRSFTPQNRRTPGAGALEAADWTRLAAGRALLFVHGTFSTAHGAFGQIPDEVFAELYRRYAGRVFAFNHPSLSDDPRANVDWLLKQLPVGLSLDLDIICHSRGGLVARTLAERQSAFGLAAAKLRVHRIVFVAVPNQGTLLAQPDHMVTMVDRLTTALNLFPTGAVVETLEALITVIKVIGHGALKGLPGLAAMCPRGELLSRLNQGAAGGGGYYAIAADFEPASDDLKLLVAGRVADQVADRVFLDAANDLVVPEFGVFDSNGSAAFPIPAERVLRIPATAGVIHTTVFAYPPTSDKLLQWLP